MCHFIDRKLAQNCECKRYNDSFNCLQIAGTIKGVVAEVEEHDEVYREGVGSMNWGRLKALVRRICI